MKKFLTKQNLLRLASYILVAALASTATWFIAPRTNKLTNLSAVLQNRFIGEADPTAMEDMAAAAMVYALGDQWSYYIPAYAYGDHVENQNNGYVGVGIMITPREDGSGFEVLDVTKGGPAEEAGLLAGDIITHVDGESVANLDISAFSNLIRGRENTRVRVTVLREGESLECSVLRKEIHTKAASGQMLTDSVGLVTIDNFHGDAGKESIEAIEQLLEEGATALVFDVRNNPGGYVDELVDLLDYLLPEGDLFRSVSYMGWKEADKSDAKCLEIPMAVLINGNSISAAEFFAAALQEYDWAITVGEPTIGKAYYQTTIELGDGSAVQLSTGAYTTPKGVNLTEAGGLVPDIPVEPDDTAQTPMEDPQILAAVEALTQEKQ